MRVRKILALLLAGAGCQATTFVTVPFERYVDKPRRVVQCVPGEAPTAAGGVRIDFDYVELRPERLGPRVRDMPEREDREETDAGCGRRPTGDAVGQAIRFNLGAYQACYAEAFGRHPGLTGNVVVQAEVSPRGAVCLARVQMAPAGDEKIAGCLLDAFRELELLPSDRPYVVEVPFKLLPEPGTEPPLPARGTIAEIEACADAELARAHGEHAVRLLSALLAAAPRHAHAPRWREEADRARRLSEPWLYPVKYPYAGCL